MDWRLDPEWARDPETESFKLLLAQRRAAALQSLLAKCRAGDLNSITKLVGKYDELTDLIGKLDEKGKDDE